MLQCVFCEKTETVNTEMSVALEDGTKVSVSICDEHAEDATPKKAREAYVAKQAKINEFLAQAKALGLDVTINKGGISTAEAKPKKAPAQRQVRQEIPEEPLEEALDETPEIITNDEGIVDATNFDRKVATARSVAGNLSDLGRVDGFASHNPSSLSDKIDQKLLKGQVKVERVIARDGRPTEIQSRRQDGLGTLIVSVRNTMTDVELQRRTKAMAEGTKTGHHAGFKDGYALRRCNLCNGNCTVRSKGQTINCPKCGGAGEL